MSFPRLLVAFVGLQMVAAYAGEGSASTPAIELERLAVAIERIKIDSEDPVPSEMAYVGIRSAALFYAISTFVRDTAMSEALEETMKRGNTFYVVGARLSASLGQSQDSIHKQTAMLGRIYSESMAASKNLNNNVFSPLVRDDLAAANKVYPLFAALVDTPADPE